MHINFDDLLQMTTCKNLARLFGLSADDVVRHIEGSEVEGMDYREPKKLAEIVDLFVNVGILKSKELPKDVFIDSYNERGNLIDSVQLTFCVGRRFSDSIYGVVVAVGNKCIIFSDSTGAVGVGTANLEIMFLDGELVIDEFKKLNYVRLRNITLEDMIWKDSFLLKDGEELKVKGTVVIEADCPINANGRIYISGEKGSKLILRNTDYAQPCIGSKTLTNLSYGRWSVAGERCAHIVIEGVEVVCESENKLFMLGEFGTDNIPEVERLNGGSLSAIEMFHDRKMVKKQTIHAGSTKYTDYPIYCLKAKSALDTLNCM